MNENSSNTFDFKEPAWNEKLHCCDPGSRFETQLNQKRKVKSWILKY